MKILFLDQFGEPGGAQQCLLDLLPAIRSRNWQAHIAASPGTLLDRARSMGAETTALPLGAYTNAKKTVRDYFRFPLDTARIARWVRRQKADLVYVNGPRLLPAALACGRRPVIFHAHHFIVQPSAAALTRHAVRLSAATVIANSRHVASQYQGASDQLHVVYNGVSPIPFQRRRFGHNDKWTIGLIGRIAPMKGQADFLRAAAQLAPHLPGATFVLCGEPMFSRSDYWSQVQRLAENLPVEFLGWRDDVASVLSRLDLLAVPSTTAESTTRVILEAWSAGVPVVAYSAGGIPEIIHDSIDGFLVAECNPQALAQKILEATKRNLTSTARRAHQAWQSSFTLERWRNQIVQVIAQMVSAPAATPAAHPTASARKATDGEPGASRYTARDASAP